MDDNLVLRPSWLNEQVNVEGQAASRGSRSPLPPHLADPNLANLHTDALGPLPDLGPEPLRTCPPAHRRSESSTPLTTSTASSGALTSSRALYSPVLTSCSWAALVRQCG